MRAVEGHGRSGPAVETNEVHLIGRVSDTPHGRELPSGDPVVLFRMVVAREPTTPRWGRHPGSVRQPRVDTIDVACWSASARRSASRLHADDTVEITGALRRRFFRVGSVAQSRYEVEARTVRRHG